MTIAFLSDQIGGSDCETIRDSMLAQPTNALTSALYILAATVVLWRMPRTERLRTGGLFSLLLALIGIGSVLYHGPQPPGSRLLHDVPIPGLIALIVIVLLLRWRRHEVLLPGYGRAKVAVLVATSIIGPLAWFTGRTGNILCDPDSFAQPHGLWHLCTAIGFAIVGDMMFRPRGGPKDE